MVDIAAGPEVSATLDELTRPAGREDPYPRHERLREAGEELLRHDSPVQIVGRVAWADTEVAGAPVAAGDHLVAYLGAGNRDPRRFTDPERLDLTRRPEAALSFGGGIHYCLGVPLARLEARIAFPALMRRFPDLRVVDGAQRRDSLTLRGFTRLPISTGAA